MKFLKTIRFDSSDENVFERSAGEDEWAISGGFVFSGLAEDDVKKGKVRQAFANGFLSTESYGHSTFTSVADCTEEELASIAEGLAGHFVENYGAPDIKEALPFAQDEVRFVVDLCKDSLINTIFTVRRSFGDDGQIKEEFRTIKSPDARPVHTRIWSVEEADD